MKSKKLNSGTVLIFDTGDEVVSTLTKFAKEHRVAAAHFTAIGAFSDAGIGYFDLQKKDYLKNQINEQVEVISREVRNAVLVGLSDEQLATATQVLELVCQNLAREQDREQ